MDFLLFGPDAMNRRQFIKTGLALGTAAALGVTLYPVVTAESITEPAAQGPARTVLLALVPALLFGALPKDTHAAQQQIAATVDAALAFLPYLPKRQQHDLQQLFVMLDTELLRLALAGHLTPLADLPVAARLALLHGWRDSFIALLNQAYSGLRELLYGSYYGNPEHWTPIAYQPLEFRSYE